MIFERISTFLKNSVAQQILAIGVITAVIVATITLTALYAGKTPITDNSSISRESEELSILSEQLSEEAEHSSQAAGESSSAPEQISASLASSSENSEELFSSSVSSFSNSTPTNSSQGTPVPTCTPSTPGTPVPTCTPGTPVPYYDSKIGIWYTVWWQDDASGNPYNSLYRHWADWSRMEPVRGYYSSGDTEIIRTHMSLFNEYGIDYVILDDTNGHGNDGGSIASNIDKIFAAVRSMGSDNAPEIAIALGGEFNIGDAADPYGSRQQEADLIYSRYAQSYSDIYFKWKNRPLLVSYGLVKYQSWDDQRFTVRRATGNVNEWRFSGTALPSTGIWGWVFNSQVNNPEVYGVIPGFNKGAIQGDTANTYMDQIKRQHGEHYMDMWLEAIEANRETIVITSWNDFAEEPAIEAMNPISDELAAANAARTGYPYDVRHARDLLNGTDRHNIWLDYYGEHAPFWYEEITWAYASLKTTLLDGYYYREVDEPEVYQYLNGQLVYQDKMPHGHPVIKIPEGYFDWFMQ